MVQEVSLKNQAAATTLNMKIFMFNIQAKNTLQREQKLNLLISKTHL